MTPEWIRLTRLDDQARHFQVSHIISIGSCEEGSLIRGFGAALEAVRETPDEIMALLGVDARPAARERDVAMGTEKSAAFLLLAAAASLAETVGRGPPHGFRYMDVLQRGDHEGTWNAACLEVAKRIREMLPDSPK